MGIARVRSPILELRRSRAKSGYLIALARFLLHLALTKIMQPVSV
jgi:hypothetical protein